MTDPPTLVPPPVAPRVKLTADQVEAMIGHQVEQLLAERDAHIAQHGKPLLGDIPPPTARRLRGQLVWPARTVTLWALRIGYHRDGINGVPVISYLGMAVRTGLTEQWYRVLKHDRVIPPPRFVMALGGMNAPFWPLDEQLVWLAQHGKFSTVSA